jgi:transposase-like protein
MTKRTRRTFPQDFKLEAVRLAQAGNGNIAAVARNLDVHDTTLRDWIRQADAPAPDSAPLTPSEKQELLQLRRDVAVLKSGQECGRPDHASLGDRLPPRPEPCPVHTGSK